MGLFRDETLNFCYFLYIMGIMICLSELKIMILLGMSSGTRYFLFNYWLKTGNSFQTFVLIRISEVMYETKFSPAFRLSVAPTFSRWYVAYLRNANCCSNCWTKFLTTLFIHIFSYRTSSNQKEIIVSRKNRFRILLSDEPNTKLIFSDIW